MKSYFQLYIMYYISCIETLETICNNQSYDEPCRSTVPHDLLHIQRIETFKYITDIIEIYTTMHDFWNKPYDFFFFDFCEGQECCFLFVDKPE